MARTRKTARRRPPSTGGPVPTVARVLERPPVPGLEPGRLYRRVRGLAPGHVPGLDGWAPEEGWPAAKFVEPVPAHDAQAGRAGWFVNEETKQWHVWAAADVEPVVDALGRTPTQVAAQTCARCDKPRYSRGLCTTHYSRARAAAVDQGRGWAAALEALQ